MSVCSFLMGKLCHTGWKVHFSMNVNSFSANRDMKEAKSEIVLVRMGTKHVESVDDSNAMLSIKVWYSCFLKHFI